jgi:glyoxylate reductase
VSNYAVGFDNVDVAACTRRGVAVGNTAGVLTETTADFAFALLMAAARRITEGRDYVRADAWHTWGPLLLLGTDVHQATLGIIGFGRIGRALARRASGFDMTVLYHDAVRASAADEAALRARSVPLEELLAASDFISLHVSLTAETSGMIGRDAFRQMKPTAIVVNTSRGPVIDPAALYEALRHGVIGGAALDVTDPEPMRAGDPLLTLPNCLVVPHIASASRVARRRMAEIAAANLVAGLGGQRLPSAVNPEVAPRR